MKQFKVGLQLYSVRDKLKDDMDGTLKAVKEMGYDYVEFAGFFGKTAEEVKAMLDKYDLKAVSVHQGVDLFLEKGQEAIDYLKKVGVTYCAIPWYGKENHKGTPGWEKTVENFTAYGKALKENGIQLMYHNHDFEFDKFEGRTLLDWLYETISAEILEPEFDVCWISYAGYSPVEYIEKYSGRQHVLHLKDFVCKNLNDGPVYALIGADGENAKEASKDNDGFEFRPVGSGVQDFPAILAAAEKAGVEYVIVEQDNCGAMDCMEAVKISRDYLKTLGL